MANALVQPVRPVFRRRYVCRWDGWHPVLIKMHINTPRFLAVGATAVAGFVALGLALPNNAPEPRLLLDPPDRVDQPLADPLLAMAPWRAFPIGADPRPMVVFNTATLPASLRAGPALDALVQGRWVGPNPLPSSPPRLDAYPILSAEAALASLRRSVLGQVPGMVSDPGPDPDAEPVRISEVRLTQRTFDTDRGRLTLPAWTVLFAKSPVPATRPRRAG